MGGSQWREAYSTAQQAEELFAAAEAASLFAGARPPVFIGHSFGARAVAHAIQSRERALTGAILVDSTIMHDRLPAFGEGSAPRYASLAEALSRFNLRPAQQCANLFLIDAIARAGVEETDGGWRWRFDPDYYRKYAISTVWPPSAELACRLAFVYGEDSAPVTAAELAAQQRQAPPGTPFIGIPDAGHHVMLDQPIALTVALRALLESWFNSAD
jgi:pimeloyl-ACP methyl ester carboxylesterase